MLTLSVTPESSLTEWLVAVQVTELHIKKAAVRSLNKTARWVRPIISRRVAQELDIKVSLIKNGLVITRARANYPEARVGLSQQSGIVKAVNLGSARQTATGISVGRRKWDHAFLATMPSGHTGVYTRTRKSRLPINEIQIVFTGRLAKAMEDLADGQVAKRFQIVFERELRFIMRAV